MEVRKIPVAQGIAWFRAAIDIGARNPRAVFGAALLFIATLYLAVGVMVGVGAMLQALQGVAMKLAAVFLNLLFLAVFVSTPILIGGLMHVIREAEADRPVRPRDLFAPFRSPRARSLAGLGMLQIVASFLVGALMIAIAGPSFWENYVDALQTAAGGGKFVLPESDKLWLVVIVYVALNYLMYAVMLFAVPLVLFSNLGIVDAVRNAFKAAVRNVGANLVATALFVGGTIVGGIVAVLVSLLLATLGNLVHPLVGGLLSLMPMLGFTAALLVVLAGGAYIAWRDTFGGEPPSASRPFGGIEA